MTTEAQIAANKINAEHSTGPKNTGKTRFNALKHCITRKILGKEDNFEINELIELIGGELKPKNIIEDIAINRIALSLWKLNKITNIQSLSFYNGEVSANEGKFLDERPMLAGGRLKACPEVSGSHEALQRYEQNAENSLHKAINLVLKIRKEKLGLFL